MTSDSATIFGSIVIGVELLVVIAMLFLVTKTGRYWFKLWKVKLLSKNRPGTLFMVTEDDEFQAGKQITSHLFPTIELAKAWAMTKQFERSYKRYVYRLLEVNEISWPDDPRALLEARTIEASRQSES